MTDNETRGFLFDLDGVLIDSEKEYSKLWARVNEEFPTGIESLEEKIKGTTLTDILDTHYPDPEIREKVVALLYEMEAHMKYEFMPGANDLLDKIKSHRYPMALVTSSNNDKMRHLEDELPGLTDIFDVVITGDMVEHSKPDPEGYLLAAQMLGCEPEKCVVFEDSLQGVKAGSFAGSYVIGIEGTLKGEVLEPFSDRVVNTLVDFDLEGVAEILKER